MTANAKDVTVSLDTRILKVIDAHCAKTGLKRSTFLQRAALTAIGGFEYKGVPVAHNPTFEALNSPKKPEKPAMGQAAKVLLTRPKKR